MRLTARRRALVAIVVTWPLAYYYIDWESLVLANIFRRFRADYVQCNNRVEAISIHSVTLDRITLRNTCSRYSCELRS